MDKILAYIRSSYDELLYKVEWPERSNLLQSAIAVVAALAIFTIIIFFMDGAFNFIIEKVYSIK